MMIKKVLRGSFEKKTVIAIGFLFFSIVIAPYVYWQIGPGWLSSTPSAESLHLCFQYWENVRQTGVFQYDVSYWVDSGYLKPPQYVIRGFWSYRFGKGFDYVSWLLTSSFGVVLIGNYLKGTSNGQTR